ncbi:MAG: clostripain-related cysteine peptidase [Elusimicrobiaceae bacterium]
MFIPPIQYMRKAVKTALACFVVFAAVTGGAFAAGSVTAGARTPLPQWTIMVYMNGKNNLEPDAFRNFFQMEAVGSNPNVNVVVQFGRTAAYSTLDGAWTGCRRYLIEQHVDTDTISTPFLSSTSVCDMGDYNDAIDFFNWGKTNYPADHYMAVLWNHGSGWSKSRAQSRTRAISYDDETGHHINTPQMKDIMSAIGHTDIYGSDACLMQTMEVVYELKDYIDYIVGSQELEPSEGYEYHDFLNAVNASDFSPQAVAQAVVDTYIAQYTDEVTQSYVQSSALAGLAARLDTLVSSMTAANEPSLALTAATSTFSYGYGSYGLHDLVAFASGVAENTDNADVRTAALDVVAYTTGSVVLYNAARGVNYENSNGLSIYLPNSYSVTGYNELDFAQDTGWQQFIYWMTNYARVSGTVVSNGLAVAGATITVTGGVSSTTVTDANGNYSMVLQIGGSYALSAAKTGYSFLPVSVSTGNLRSDWDADFSTERHVLSGYVRYNGVGVGGATVSLGGSSTATATTDFFGAYSFSVEPAQTFTVTPTKPGYVFSPVTLSLTSYAHDQPGNNFTAASGQAYALLSDLSSYPNPFAALKGEKAKIHYALDTDRECRIRIYNTAGQLVWDHTSYAGSDGGKAGPNEVLWDGHNGDGKSVGRGIYLAVVEAGGAREIVKVGVR